MRDIMQGFTMYVEGQNHGIDTEVVKLMMPKAKTQEYQGGGMDMAVNQPMASLEAMEIGVKFSGLNVDVSELIARRPGLKVRTSFRLAVKDGVTGNVIPHVAVCLGEYNSDSADDLQRGEKAGFDLLIQGVTYFKRMAGPRVIHLLNAYPPRRVVGGVDQLKDINYALGY
ncbi:phage major tail tube protein [Pseudovibrio ascidiaceicola]|uniref:phage major tail tube protein n=1 Tax=Pseudovibrio ascidiaceicola TaxID=285279 RepID=UPI003D36614A